jgi:hypothetical protein
MEEIWKDVKNYEGVYQVSNFGNVKSLPRQWIGGLPNAPRKHNGLVLSSAKDKKGYLRVLLSKPGERHTYKVHRLVAIAFIENPENKKEVNHINGIKTDNRLCNLEWCSTMENMRHSILIGLRDNVNIKGENHPLKKLSESQVKDIRSLKEGGNVSSSTLANVFGVSYYTIWDIVNRRSWVHI